MVATRTSGIATSGKTLLGMILLTVGFLATLATVLGFFGGIWWAFDLAANWRLQLGVVLVVVAVLYWVTVGRGAAILFLVAGLVNLFLVLPVFFGSQATAAPEGRLDVVSYNVATEVAGRDEMIDWIGSLDADIVFLQETTAAWVEAIAASGIQMDIIAEPITTGGHGTTVLASQPATATVIPVGAFNQHVIEVTTTVDGRAVSLFGAHPDTATTKQKADVRDELFTELAALVAAAPNPAIVVGDLGVTRWTSAFGSLADAASLVNSEDGFGYEGTWPGSDLTLLGDYLSIPVDHVLMTREMTVVARDVGPKIGSANRPVVAKLAFAGG